MTRIATSSLIQNQVPEFVRADYPTFVAFVEAYYEYMDANGVDLKSVRDLDYTLDNFIEHFRKELAFSLPAGLQADERFLLAHIKDQYLAKGSEGSFKLLFRLLYDKEVGVKYPGLQMLRASDGRWQQDVSMFIKVTLGNPDMIDGKLVDIVKPNRVLQVLIDRRQYVEIEVRDVVQLSGDTYEVFIDRKYFGDIEVGDQIRYKEIFAGEIVATTAKIEIVERGTGFKDGQLFEIKNGSGVRSIVKVTRTGPNGEILSAEFIKFGVGYATDFTISVNATNDYYTSTNDALLSSVTIVTGGVAITDRTRGFKEQGYISRFDYNTFDPTIDLAPSWVASTAVPLGSFVQILNRLYKVTVSGNTGTTAPTHMSGTATNGTATLAYTGLANASAVDGSFVGQVLREYSVAPSAGVQVSTEQNCLLKVYLGPLAKYPGYYSSNQGFLSDAVFIQDSKYYQAFSYVLRIDERLANYKTAVKTMVHPAGTALFGEFEIQNNFDISIQLQSLVKTLGLSLKDTVSVENGAFYYHLQKPLADGVIATEALKYLMQKALATTLAPQSDLATKKTFKVLATTLAQQGDLVTKKTFKSLTSVNATPVDVISKKDVTKLLNDVATPTEAMTRRTNKYLLDTTVGTLADDGYVARDSYSEGAYFSIHPIIYDNTIESTFGATVNTNPYT
jgi:hypothetical protein